MRGRERKAQAVRVATAGGTVSIDPKRGRGADGRFDDRIKHFDWRIIFPWMAPFWFGAPFHVFAEWSTLHSAEATTCKTAPPTPPPCQDGTPLSTFYDVLTGAYRAYRQRMHHLSLEAAQTVVRHKQGSVSLLQRTLGIGYQRAARLIDKLEAAGIVSAYDGSKAREVLVDKAYLEQMMTSRSLTDLNS